MHCNLILENICLYSFLKKMSKITISNLSTITKKVEDCDLAHVFEETAKMENFLKLNT